MTFNRWACHWCTSSMHLQSSLNCVETDKLHVCSPACSQSLRKRREDRREKWEDGSGEVKWANQNGLLQRQEREVRENKMWLVGEEDEFFMQTDETKMGALTAYLVADESCSTRVGGRHDSAASTLTPPIAQKGRTLLPSATWLQGGEREARSS